METQRQAFAAGRDLGRSGRLGWRNTRCGAGWPGRSVDHRHRHRRRLPVGREWPEAPAEGGRYAGRIRHSWRGRHRRRTADRGVQCTPAGWAGPGKPWGHSASSMADWKSVVEGKSVSVGVDLGGRRIIQKKYQIKYVILITHNKPKL